MQKSYKYKYKYDSVANYPCFAKHRILVLKVVVGA